MKKIQNLKAVVLLSIAVLFLENCTKDQSPASDQAVSSHAKTTNLSSSIGNVVDMDMNSHDSCYYWYRTGMMSVGTSTNSTAYIALKAYTLPSGKTPYNIVAVGIAKNNYCYFWYDDGTVSIGNSTNAGAYSSPVSYTIPSGESTTTILAMSIAKQGSSNVYTWYKDGTATVGSPTSLGSIRSNYPYTVAAGESVTNIVGIGIAGSNDHTYVWYNNGTTEDVSSGYTNQFDAYFGIMPASF